VSNLQVRHWEAVLDVGGGQTVKLDTVPLDVALVNLIGNARCRTCKRFAPRDDPGTDWPMCECAEPDRLPVVPPKDSQKGKTLLVCGAGPSLRDAEGIKTDHTWGCNRAASYLEAWGWPLTHAFCIDASTMMLEPWRTVPQVSESYLLSTSCHWAVVDHVLLAGQRVELFHCVRALEDEFRLYGHIWPDDVPIVGNGLNSVNRALGLADWLGYDKAYVAGSDCALKGDAFYADGTGRDTVYLEATIDGKFWKTTPDMLMSATDLARAKWTWGDRLEIVGDSLGTVFADKDEAFLLSCVRWGKPPAKDST
jgi:hypothetical protein